MSIIFGGLPRQLELPAIAPRIRRDIEGTPR
jgi:hypothetical protein